MTTALDEAQRDTAAVVLRTLATLPPAKRPAVLAVVEQALVQCGPATTQERTVTIGEAR